MARAIVCIRSGRNRGCHVIDLPDLTPGEKEAMTALQEALDEKKAPAPVFDRPDGLERPTADWSRDDAGRPWLLPDPTWTPEQTERWLAGRAKDGRVPYTRVTTFVEALLDGTMLGRWKMRRVALGMGRRPDYVVAAAGLTAEDRDKKALNDLAEKALEASGPNAADIGTALHQFSERIDRGEPLGFVPDQYRADLDAYREQVQRVRWLHREERMVCDRLETAGTPDGLGYVDEPDPDGVVDLLRVIDLKTGNVETTAGKFSAQLGVYANSALYDPRTGKRTWLADLDKRWGVVLHMPAGLGTAELRWLNLEHGWLGAQLAGPVRKWRTVNWADLMRPLVAPEPRTVEPGKCAGRKRDGAPCTYKAVSGGFCGRHQDQVGTDPDAPVNARVREAAAVLTETLANVPEALRLEQPATVVLEDDALLDKLDQLEHGETPAPTGDPVVEQPQEKLPGELDPERCATTDLLVDQCACPVHRPDLASTGSDGAAPDEPREPGWTPCTCGRIERAHVKTAECEQREQGKVCKCVRLAFPHIRTTDCRDEPEPNDGPGPDGHHRVTGECFACMVGVATGPESHGERCPLRRPQPEPEQNGNPTPYSTMQTPEDAADAARKAELALMDQVRACRTTGELDVLWQQTGQAWTHSVKQYAVRHRQLLPELAQQERTHAALAAAIAAAENGSELHALGVDPANRPYWTPELIAAAKARAAELPPF